MQAKCLVYGPFGAGKTALGVSSFWDWRRQKQIRNGRLVLIGSEGNPALGVPEELIKRFRVEAGKTAEFVKAFETALKAWVMLARRRQGLEALVVDGFSELGAVFETFRGDETTDKWTAWRELKDAVIRITQYLTPEELGCHIIGTARVMKRRQGIKDKTDDVVKGADPDWFDSEYYPAMEGWARENLGHYFNLVAYMNADTKEVRREGKRVTEAVHRLHLIRDGRYAIKNVWAHGLIGHGLPTVLDNPAFDDLLGLLERASLPIDTTPTVDINNEGESA